MDGSFTIPRFVFVYVRAPSVSVLHKKKPTQHHDQTDIIAYADDEAGAPGNRNLRRVLRFIFVVVVDLLFLVFLSCNELRS